MQTTTTAFEYELLPTIIETLPDYVRRLQGRKLSPRTVESYSRDLRAFERWLHTQIEHVPTLTDITTHAIEQWQDDHAQLSATTVIKTLTALKSHAQWCIRKALRADDPTALIDWPRKADSLPRPLALEQLRDLDILLSRPPSPRHRRVVLLALYAGLRRSEIANLDWANVNLSAQTIAILNAKWGGSRSIPIHPRLLADLVTTSIAKRIGAVCGTPEGTFYDDEMIAKVFSEWVQARTMLADVTCHRLRHTFATQLLQAGIDIRIIAELMGHRDTRTTMRYTLVISSQRVAAIARLPMGFRPDAPPTRMAGVCAWCEQPIFGSARRRFCSNRCKWAARDVRRGNTRHKPTRAPLICRNCQQPLPVGQRSAFCGGSCKGLFYRAAKKASTE
jgi:site-specific recombinase XerD